MQVTKTDIAILGGGLAGGLIALALAARRPDLRAMLVEREERLGGNHVWSFFATDLSPEGAALVDPLVAARWDGYDVRFPHRTRTLSTGYRSITSASFDAALRAALPAGAILCGTAIASATATTVTLADGRTIAARAIIDARGTAHLPHMAGGWQKFLGQKLRMSTPHGLTQPLLMDATVAQHDGYRFVYCLPFSPTELFVEDTYYSESPALDAPLLRDRITQYCRAAGWTVGEILAEETGVLPVVATGDYARFRAAAEAEGHGQIALAGLRAGLFHPLTSYSLPVAVRFALDLADTDDLWADGISGAGLAAASGAWAAQHWRRGRFYRMLVAMLFGAADPAQRYRVLERFYGLDHALIERFYAGDCTMKDKLRILSGKPPVPIGAALAALCGRVPFAPLETNHDG